MLQECHCTENTNPVWSAEWRYQAIFSTFSSKKSRFNNKFNFQIQKLFVDPSGRFIICDIQANSKSLTLANIYAPKEDSPAFFLDFFDHLSNFNCDDIVIGGDYNLVLDLEIDKRGGLFRTNQTSVKIVKEFCEKLVLADDWRILHPESSRYTWKKRRPSIHSSLDFFLTSQSVVNNVTIADINLGYKNRPLYDHVRLLLTFKSPWAGFLETKHIAPNRN